MQKLEEIKQASERLFCSSVVKCSAAGICTSLTKPEECCRSRSVNESMPGTTSHRFRGVAECFQTRLEKAKTAAYRAAVGSPADLSRRGAHGDSCRFDNLFLSRISITANAIRTKVGY